MAEKTAKEPSVVGKALLTAARNGHLDVVKHLIGQGAQVDNPTTNGTTALLFASDAGHRDVVEYLVVSRSEVEYLVGQGAQVERGANNGFTPLHGASRMVICHLDVVQYLVGQGAHVKRENNAGETPLLVASSNGHLDVVQYLTSKQAKKEEAPPEVKCTFGMNFTDRSIQEQLLNPRTITQWDQLPATIIKESTSAKSFHTKVWSYMQIDHSAQLYTGGLER
ncbi:alpha-latrotoxin-Lt1a-like [Strongylocentrotus purpuratus]|uniref:Uncharacterized protein n=1 Tax=Strongylocentrotus purpuratus TaxID=7668 RepID=A0A7M7P3C3_STRPU|nr:alpha-latrotoxin-Lt1a-like [Strongylocentrotus purpuratus]